MTLSAWVVGAGFSFAFADMIDADLHIPGAVEAEWQVRTAHEEQMAREALRRSTLESVPALAEWSAQSGPQPVRLRQVVPPAPVPTPVASVATDLRLVGFEYDELTEALEPRGLTLTATVLDDGLSAIHWRDDHGAEWLALSNVDFNYLSGLHGFSDASHAWTTFIFVDDLRHDAPGSVAEGQAFGKDVSGAASASFDLFPGAEPDYVVVAGEGAGVPTALHEELEALHRHYAENELRLIAGHERNRVLDEARERWRAANPPQPREVVINFWRVR